MAEDTFNIRNMINRYLEICEYKDSINALEEAINHECEYHIDSLFTYHKRVFNTAVITLKTYGVDVCPNYNTLISVPSPVFSVFNPLIADFKYEYFTVDNNMLYMHCGAINDDGIAKYRIVYKISLDDVETMNNDNVIAKIMEPYKKSMVDTVNKIYYGDNYDEHEYKLYLALKTKYEKLENKF